LEGHSHVIVALAGAVAVDSLVGQFTGTPLSGPLLTTPMSQPATLSILVIKGIFYLGVAIGGLTPDIDNARSTLGQKLGFISKEIMHHFGHRTIMHSLIGLGIFTALAFGAQQLVVNFLASHLPDKHEVQVIDGSKALWLALVLGYILHLFGDSLTEEGIPIFWPAKWHLGFPPFRSLRFRAGSWAEPIAVWLIVILVGVGLWQNVIHL
jgi:inner membrane protein